MKDLTAPEFQFGHGLNVTASNQFHIHRGFPTIPQVVTHPNQSPMEAICPLGHQTTTQLANGDYYCESCAKTDWGSDEPHWDQDQITTTEDTAA